MKLAPISAPQWADKVQRGDYHMVIAPWLFEIPGYAQYYNKAARPKGTHVLVDNGAFEGYQLSFEAITRAVAIARADEVVLPDIRGAGKKTLERSAAILPLLAEDDALSGVVFVAQGQTQVERAHCLESWVSYWEKEKWNERFQLCLGLTSKPPNQQWRVALLKIARDFGYPMHMLGLPNVQEFINYDLPQGIEAGVRDIDTSLPFALACARQLLTPDSTKVPLLKPHHYACLGQWTLTRAHLNILILRHWLDLGEATRVIPIEIIRQAAGKVRRVYESPQAALRLSRVPEGRYAVSYKNKMPRTVLPLKPGEETEHKIVEVYYG